MMVHVPNINVMPQQLLLCQETLDDLSALGLRHVGALSVCTAHNRGVGMAGR